MTSRLVALLTFAALEMAVCACPATALRLASFKGAVKDFSPVLQRAIDSLDRCSGGEIRISPGTYSLARPVSLKGRNGIHLVGAGSASILRFASPGARFELNMANEISFDSLRFEYQGGRHGIRALVSETGSWGPRKVAIRHSALLNCGIHLGTAADTSGYWGREAEITGNVLSGYLANIQLTHWAKAKVSGNTVSAQEYSRNPDEHNVSGIRLESGSRDVAITGNTAFHCAQNGIQVHSGRDILIAHNLVHDNDQSGIGLNSNQTDLYPERVRVVGNVCRGNRYDGIDINVVPLRTVVLTLENNACHGNQRAGIYVHGAIGVSILGNTCFWNGNAGIHVNRSEFAVISANRLFSNAAIRSESDSDLDRGGITLQGSEHCAVVANVSGNEGPMATQAFGIHLADSIARSAVHGNRMEGNLSAALKLSAVDSMALRWDSPGEPVAFPPLAKAGAAAPSSLLEGPAGPEGVVSAPPGVVYRRGAGAAAFWFVKEANTGPAGWRQAAPPAESIPGPGTRAP